MSLCGHDEDYLGGRGGSHDLPNDKIKMEPFFTFLTKKSAQNTKKTIAKRAFCDIGNPDPGNLINTVVYEDFWRPFAKNDEKHPGKH